MALQMQAATTTRFHTPTSLDPTANAGLGPHFNSFALKSPFFSGLLNVYLHPNQHHLTSTTPRISMHVTSKQTYTCRDCGYIYNDKTPFEKLPDNYLYPVCGAPKRRFRPYTTAVTKNVVDEQN